MPALHLFRHGQASFGEQDYDALTELGFAQGRRLGVALATRGQAPAFVVTGNMRRHRETATACLDAWRTALVDGEAAAREQQPVDVQTDAAFDEFDHEQIIATFEPRYADRMALFEDIAGAPNPLRAFEAIFSAAMQRWVSGEHDSDYAEPWPAFEARVAAGIERIEARLAQAGRGSSAWVFTSGGPITTTVRSLLSLDVRAALRMNKALVNAGETKVVLGRSGRSLSTLNEHGALQSPGGELLTYR